MIDYKNDIRDNILKDPEYQKFKFKTNKIIFSKKDDMLLKRLVIGTIVSSLLIGINMIEQDEPLSDVIGLSIFYGCVSGGLIMLSPIIVPLCGIFIAISMPLTIWHDIRKE